MKHWMSFCVLAAVIALLVLILVVCGGCNHIADAGKKVKPVEATDWVRRVDADGNVWMEGCVETPVRPAEK